MIADPNDVVSAGRASFAPAASPSSSPAATIDIAQLRVAEARVTDLAEHLQLALEAGDLGTWSWDIATGITTWDAAMCRLYGRDPADGMEIPFEEWVELLHPDDVQQCLDIVNEAMGDPGPYQMEHRVRWPDGTEHWLSCRGSVRVDEHGAPMGTIGCSGDVTERKRVDLDRDRRMDEAEEIARGERLARERLEFLARINDCALDAADHTELMATVTQAAVPRLGDWCTLHFLGEPGAPPVVHVAHVDPEKVRWVEELQARYPYDPDAATGVAAVIRSGEAELVQVDQALIDEAIETSAVPADEVRNIVEQLHLTSLITVPLRTSRGVIGAMQFVSAESGRIYGDDDLALAHAASGRVAAALDNAWLNQQYRGVAAALQQGLLPVTVPPIEGVDVAVRYWAAGLVNEVGGDFYDVFPLGPDRWGIVIGDVCGTGPQAAAVTAKARHTIRAGATHGVGHVEVLGWVNDAILNSGRGRFCTVLYATLERVGDDRWTFTVASAGHPLPVLVDREGAHLVGRPGTLAGVLPELKLTVTTRDLHRGDTLVLYTDGFTDVRPPHDLTDDEMQAIIADAATRSTAEEVADALRSSIDEILSFEHRYDDMALVVLRVE
ncbi:MAG: SpoIIE family protein phosphatase [Acidimicrobiales bacterium]